jgi:hypothetical protein
MPGIEMGLLNALHPYIKSWPILVILEGSVTFPLNLSAPYKNSSSIVKQDVGMVISELKNGQPLRKATPIDVKLEGRTTLPLKFSPPYKKLCPIAKHVVGIIISQFSDVQPLRKLSTIDVNNPSYIKAIEVTNVFGTTCSPPPTIWNV